MPLSTDWLTVKAALQKSQAENVALTAELAAATKKNETLTAEVSLLTPRAEDTAAAADIAQVAESLPK